VANEVELALCRRAAAGDEGAFAALLEAHAGALRSFLRKLGATDPDDVAQEAFLRAWRAAGQYDGRARYATWLTRIAWRCFLDQQRGRSHREPPNALEEPRATSETPLAVRSLLGALPERERAVLILCDGHGWTHEEAAAMLGLPLGTLKSLAARAKARARTLWEAQA
jgi:RNA polymerase sigma factor (sigma-70 family)